MPYSLQILATSGNKLELTVATFIMIGGGILWGQLIGTFCGVFSQLNPSTRNFREDLSSLNTFMAKMSLPTEMRFRLREYLFESVHVRDSSSNSRILAQISPVMRGEMQYMFGKPWLERVWFLGHAELEMLIDLSSRLRALVLPPNDMAPAGIMYLVGKGIGLWAGKVKNTGGVWGEDILLDSDGLQLTFTAVAITYMWTYTLTAQDLHAAIARAGPATQAALHRCRVRWLMRRGFIQYADDTRRKLVNAKAASAEDGPTTKTTAMVISEPPMGDHETFMRAARHYGLRVFESEHNIDTPIIPDDQQAKEIAILRTDMTSLQADVKAILTLLKSEYAMRA